MPTIADSLFDRNSIAVEERIGKTSMQIMQTLDPSFFDFIVPDMVEMSKADELGRDLLIKKRYHYANAGVMEHNNLQGYADLVGSATQAFGNKFNTMRDFSPWPDARDSPYPTPFGMTMGLHSIRTNLPLPRDLLLLDATPANIKEQVSPILQGFANRMARNLVEEWYKDPALDYRRCSLPAAANVTISNASKTISFNPVEQNIHTFHEGDLVDMYSDTNTRLNQTGGGTRINLMVVTVDYWENRITLQADPGDTTFTTWCTTGTIGNTAFLTTAGTGTTATTRKGFYSWHHFAKYPDSTNNTPADAYILGNDAITTTSNDYINVNEHPMFKSGRFTNCGTMSELDFVTRLEKVEDSMELRGYYIDKLIARRGVWTAIYGSRLASMQIQRRQGEPGALRNLGWRGGFEISTSRRTYTGTTSYYIEPNRILGMRGGSNWCMIVPPKPSELQRGGLASVPGASKVPFMLAGKYLGHPSNLIPVSKTNAEGYTMPTSLVQMPGMIRMQFVPEKQIPMVVFEDVDNLTIDMDGLV